MKARRSQGSGPGKCQAALFSFILATIVPFAFPASGDGPLRRAELLILGTERPSRITVGLHLELAPGWYVYWINPGDAGLSLDVTWRVPPGFVAGSLRFPTPQKFVHAGIVAYGYKEEVLITCEIESLFPSPGARHNLTLAALLDWMACRESCLAGKENLEVSLREPSAAEKRKARAVQKRFASRYPRSSEAAGVAVSDVTLLKSDDEWRVEISFNGKIAAKITDFYPYPLADFVIHHGRIVRRGTKVVVP
ncbi:MAG: protein-disulfide reductase DsbD domain-containing protein, partial [Acidobacteriota bacterium]